MTDGYILLAGAIIRVALEDYEKYYRNLKREWKRKPTSPMDSVKKQNTLKNYLMSIEAIERFFRSEWFGILSCGLDGNYILSKTKERLDENRIPNSYGEIPHNSRN